MLHKYSWVTFHLQCMSYLPTLSAVIKHVQNLHAEVTVQMPTPLKPVFELKNGFGDKYRWLVLTLLNGWIHFLAQQVAGVWGWQIMCFLHLLRSQGALPKPLQESTVTALLVVNRTLGRGPRFLGSVAISWWVGRTLLLLRSRDLLLGSQALCPSHGQQRVILGLSRGLLGRGQLLVPVGRYSHALHFCTSLG